MAELDTLIPHYNDVDGLALSLQSIAKQTWGGERRVVIADDGSAPETFSQLERLVEGYPFRVDVLRSATNRGRPHTRNALLDAVESPFVAWLDSGDEWYPDKIATQLATLRLDPAAVEPCWVTCHYDWKVHGLEAWRVDQLTQQDQIRALLAGKSLRAYLWTIVGRAETFKDVGWFNEKLPRLQDLDYFLRFVLKGGLIVDPGVDRALCAYHKSHVGRRADEVRACNAYIFDRYRVLYNRYGQSFVRDSLYDMEMHSALFAASNNDRKRVRHYMLRAFRTNPVRMMLHLLVRGSHP